MKGIQIFLGAVILLSLSLAQAAANLPAVTADGGSDGSAEATGKIGGAIHTGMTECHDQAMSGQTMDGDPQTPFTPVAKIDDKGQGAGSGSGKAQ